MGLTISHPDIEDINDVERYCMRCWFPFEMRGGECIKAFQPSDIARGTVRGMLVNADGMQSEHGIKFSDFLKLDTGPFKAKMIETREGSIIYVENPDANARHHGLVNWAVTYFWDGQPRISPGVVMLHTVATQLLSTARTPWSRGQIMLAEGERIGIALSDRFGVITSPTSVYPQVIWKKTIVGEIIGERLSIQPKYQNLSHIIDSLLSK